MEEHLPPNQRQVQAVRQGGQAEHRPKVVGASQAQGSAPLASRSHLRPCLAAASASGRAAGSLADSREGERAGHEGPPPGRARGQPEDQGLPACASEPTAETVPRARGLMGK